MICVFLVYDGNSQRLNQKWFYGEAGNRTCDPKLFVAFPLVETSTGPGGFMICVFII